MSRVTGTRDSRGGGTVLVVACMGLLVFVAAALGVATAMVAAHRRAQAAADLAALAGASTAQTGGDACGRAAEIATANGARLSSCVVQGSDVSVSVTVAGPRWLGQDDDLEARSRAGP